MKSEGEKGRERVVGKAAGDEGVFIRARLADEVRLNAMPDAADGEGVTGPLNRKGQSTGMLLTGNKEPELRGHIRRRSSVSPLERLPGD